MPLIPFVIEKSGREERAMDIYSRLLKDRIIFLGTAINDEVANIDRRPDAVPAVRGPQGRHPPVRQLARRQRDGRAGDLRHDAVRHLRRGDVLHRPGGVMGAVLLAAGARASGNALPNARIMIHQPLAGMEGTAEDIMIHAKEFRKIKQAVESDPAQAHRPELAKIEKDTDRDRFMSSGEALEYRVDRPRHGANGVEENRTRRGELSNLVPTLRVGTEAATLRVE